MDLNSCVMPHSVCPLGYPVVKAAVRTRSSAETRQEHRAPSRELGTDDGGPTAGPGRRGRRRTGAVGHPPVSIPAGCFRTAKLPTTSVEPQRLAGPTSLSPKVSPEQTLRIAPIQEMAIRTASPKTWFCSGLGKHARLAARSEGPAHRLPPLRFRNEGRQFVPVRQA